MTVKIKTMAEAETGDAVTDDASIIEGEATTVEGDLDSTEETNEWDDLAVDDDEVEAESEFDSQDEEPGEAEEGAAEEAAEETTAESEEVSDATETEVAAEESGQETETEEIVAETPQPTQEEYDATIAEAKQKALTSLEEQFQLTEDQADALVTDPNTVLPQMLAKMYLDVYTNVMQGMQQQLPQMVHGVVQNSEVQARGKAAFHEAWPQLAKAEYSQTVERIGEAYKQMNPKATREEFIQEVGAQAWVALRLPLDELLAHTQAAPVPIADPKVTTLRTPAAAGSVPAAGKAPVQKQSNAFESLADEFLDEDSG